MKLIRDKIAERLPKEQVKSVAQTRIERLLRAKLLEEISELWASDFKSPTEWADVLEVLMGLAERNGMVWEAIEATRIDKRERCGGFDQGFVKQ